MQRPALNARVRLALLLNTLTDLTEEAAMALPAYTTYFRGRPACPCLAEWIPWFEKVLIARGVIRETVDIAQLIGSAAASANTHSTGGAFDIWQHDDVTVEVARQMGADATWARTTGSFATNKHAHGVLTGCPHNGAAAYQIAEVRAGGDGLLGSAPDPGPRPLSGRTWQQGIEWAKTQLEEDMADPKTQAQLDRIEANTTRLLAAEKARHRRLRDLLKRKFKASQADVDEILAALAED